jgi:hypothetical protein
MEYIDVLWRHESEAEPVRLVSELDSLRMETRKLEFFISGAVGVASARNSVGGTELGSVAVPPLEEINNDPQFSARSITAAEFEALWEQHVRQGI